MSKPLMFGAAILLGGTFLSGTAFAQSPCPAVGNDTQCGAVITIDQNGAHVTATGQGPYDGSDDTLIGVVNNIPACVAGQKSQTACGISIFSLDLTSSKNIFGFDGDGISSSTYGIADNPLDVANGNTQYGGPNAYFTNITGGQTSGRVNFVTPIPPGGTGFFSLENALNSATACTSILNSSVPQPAAGAPTMSTTFTPQGNDPSTGRPYTVAAAATVCGFAAFDWQQTVTNLPVPRPKSGANELFADLNTPTVAPVTPFNDPPPDDYFANAGNPSPVKIKVYYGPDRPVADVYSLAAQTAANQLSWSDSPTDFCLPGAQGAAAAAAGDADCGGAGVRAPAGSTINFTTHLVGLQAPGRTTAEALPLANVLALTPVDTGIGFNWTSNFNGTSGGTSIIRNSNPIDSGSGTGGTTITSYTSTTNYTGVGVSAINGSNNVFVPTTLLTAILPESRSAVVGSPVTAFATMINTGASTATSCSISPASSLAATFDYQTTDPTTNVLTGSVNTPVDIPANNASQSFVIAFTPSAAITPTDVAFNFTCTNTSPAPINIGLNTLLLSASTTPIPDIVALAATPLNDGILHLPGAAGASSFAVATVNLGSADTITATAATPSGVTLPVAITLCQTNPATSLCMAPPAASANATIAANGTPTFGIFGVASGAIPFDPVNNRIFVKFTDSTGAVRGETSVAVETQ